MPIIHDFVNRILPNLHSKIIRAPSKYKISAINQ